MRRAHPMARRRGKTAQQVGLQEGFKSGLEDKVLESMRSRGEHAVYEAFRLPFVQPAKKRHYTPDFRLSNGIIVETKGIFDAADRAKMLLVQAQYPGLDIRFVFTRAKTPITQGSSTTVAEWCTKYGFPWAEKDVPTSWIKEKGPDIPPEEILRRGPRLPA